MPLYFFFGEEDYMLEKEVKSLKRKLLGDTFDVINYRVLDNPDFSTFDEALRTSPMFFGEVLYVIKCDKYFIEQKTKAKLDDKQTKMLIESLENIQDRVHILLLCPVERGSKKKPDSRKKLYKAVLKLTKPVEFPSFKAWEDYKIAPVLKKLAKEKDLNLQANCIPLLVQLLGSSVRVLDSNLEKLKLSIYPENNVTEEVVKKVCLAGEDVFALVDFILKKDFTTSVVQIAKILEKSHYLELLAFLQTSFLKLLQTKIYSKILSPLEISRKTGQHEFVVKKNLQKLSKISFEYLLNLKIALTEAEYKLKTGQIDPLSAFQGAIQSAAQNVCEVANGR